MTAPHLKIERGELDPADPADEVLLRAMIAKSSKVAPGVLADVVDRGKWVEVRAILAGHPRRPGAVGRWLDTLPTDRKVIVPAVVSARLAGMLARRGFTAETWWDTTLHAADEGAMVRRPA